MLADLRYDRLGEGPALLILHGLFGSRSNWAAVARALADRFTVFLPDARNHGESPWTSSHTLDDMANDVIHLANALDLAEMGVVGHSMGGRVAMRLALTRPALVKAVASVDMAPRHYAMHERFGRILRGLRAFDPATLPTRSAAEPSLAEHVAEKPIRDFLLKNLNARPDGGYAWRLNLDVLERDLEHIGGQELETGRYDGPALFLYGTASNYVTPEDLELIPAIFPRADFAPVEGAGHWLHAERPQETVAKLRAFFEANLI